MIDGKVQTDLTPLEGLSPKWLRRQMSKALRKAGRPVRTELRREAKTHKDRGFLAQSIGQRVVEYQQTCIILIGPKSDFIREVGTRTRGKRKGQTIRARPVFYAHLIDRPNKHVKKFRPFLAPVLASTHTKFIEEMQDALRQSFVTQLSKSKR